MGTAEDQVAVQQSLLQDASARLISIQAKSDALTHASLTGKVINSLDLRHLHEGIVEVQSLVTAAVQPAAGNPVEDTGTADSENGQPDVITLGDGVGADSGGGDGDDDQS